VVVEENHWKFHSNHQSSLDGDDGDGTTNGAPLPNAATTTSTAFTNSSRSSNTTRDRQKEGKRYVTCTGCVCVCVSVCDINMKMDCIVASSKRGDARRVNKRIPLLLWNE